MREKGDVDVKSVELHKHLAVLDLKPKEYKFIIYFI